MERTLETSDGELLWGVVEGTGPPIGLCHGGPGLWDYFDDLASALNGRLTVHRWDQRGCGRSAPSVAYGLEVAVRDVQDVKAAFGVEGPWVLLGHSWGAYLALLSALEHPDSTRALIYMSGTGPSSWWRSTGAPAAAAERARRMSVGAQRRLDELERRERTWDEEVEFRRLSWSTDVVDQGSPPGALEAMASAPMSVSWVVNRSLSRATLSTDVELFDRCSRSDLPGLFIHGSEDPRPHEGAKLLSERMPNGRFLLIDGAGHLPWIEQPQATHDAIRSFIDDLA